MSGKAKTAVLCVGNSLMYDDGLGVAVYEQLRAYRMPEEVCVLELGCLSLAQLDVVRDYDNVVTVDAVDGTGEAVGTLFKYSPEEMARRAPQEVSLHNLKLVDLFDSAMLLGYEANGVCLGMQVENPSPSHPVIGLSEMVQGKLADLVDCVLAVLVSLGHEVRVLDTGELVAPGFHHLLI